MIQAAIPIAKGFGIIGLNSEKFENILKQESLIPTADIYFANNLSSILSNSLSEFIKTENQELQNCIKFLV